MQITITVAPKRSQTTPTQPIHKEILKEKEKNIHSNTSGNIWGPRKHKKKGQHKISGLVCCPETAFSVANGEIEKRGGWTSGLTQTYISSVLFLSSPCHEYSYILGNWYSTDFNYFIKIYFKKRKKVLSINDHLE